MIKYYEKKGKKLHINRILTSLFTIWLFVPVVGYAVQIGDGPFEAQPGYYWHYDGNDLNPEECPSGYYCEGFSDEYFQGDSIGATLCTDTVPNYPLSDPGASRWYQCYTTVNSGNSCSYYNNFSDDNLNPTFSTNYAVFRNYPEGEQALEDCMVTSLSCPGGGQATPNGLLTPYIFKDGPLTANPYVFWASMGLLLMDHGKFGGQMESWSVVYHPVCMMVGLSVKKLTVITLPQMI